MYRIASYLKDNPLIQEFADWFIEETGITNFYFGTYTDGEGFIEYQGVEIPFRSAIRFMRKPRQLKLI